MNDDVLVQQLRSTLEERTLVWLHQQQGGTSTQPLALNDQERLEVERTLIAYELIDPELDLAHSWYLTPRGNRIAEKLVATRTKGAGRRAAVEKALMQHIEDDEPQALEGFAAQVVDGNPVSERELEKAFEALEEFGLAKAGFKAFGGTIGSPRLSPSGRAALDDPRDPIDFVRQGGVVNNDNRNHIENHGTMNAAVAGNHAVQSGNALHGETISDLSSLLDELRQELDNIGQDVPETATGIVDQLVAEATSPQPNQSKLSLLTSSFTGAIATKFGEDAYQQIPSMIARLGILIATLA